MHFEKQRCFGCVSALSDCTDEYGSFPYKRNGNTIKLTHSLVVYENHFNPTHHNRIFLEALLCERNPTGQLVVSLVI